MAMKRTVVLLGVILSTTLLVGCSKKSEPTDATTKDEIKTSITSSKEESESTTSAKLTNDELVATVYLEAYMALHEQKDIKTAINDVLKQPEFMITESSNMFLANEHVVLVGNDVGTEITISDTKIHTRMFNGNQLLEEKDYSVDELAKKYNSYASELKEIVMLSEKNMTTISIDRCLQSYTSIGTDIRIGSSVTSDDSITRSQFIKNGSGWTWNLLDHSENIIESANVISVSNSSGDIQTLTMTSAQTKETFTLDIQPKCGWVYKLTGSTPKNDINATYQQERTEDQIKQEKDRKKQEYSRIWDDFRENYDSDTSKYTLYDIDIDFYTKGYDSFIIKDDYGNKYARYFIYSDGTMESKDATRERI